MKSKEKITHILRVEYLSNYWLDLPHILNLGLYHQSKLIKYPNEDDMKRNMISNGRLVGFPIYLKLDLYDQIKHYTCLK